MTESGSNLGKGITMITTCQDQCGVHKVTLGFRWAARYSRKTIDYLLLLSLNIHLYFVLQSVAMDK